MRQERANAKSKIGLRGSWPLRVEDRDLAIDHELAAKQGSHRARDGGEAVSMIAAGAAPETHDGASGAVAPGGSLIS
jgi:hypothetical protein